MCPRIPKVDSRDGGGNGIAVERPKALCDPTTNCIFAEHIVQKEFLRGRKKLTEAESEVCLDAIREVTEVIVAFQYVHAYQQFLSTWRECRPGGGGRGGRRPHRQG